MSAAMSPTVQAWELGIRLRKHREQIQLTAASVAKTIGCTQGYISSLEAGKSKLAAYRLEQFVELYELELDEADELEELRQGAGQRGWWYEYTDILNDPFIRFLGFESGAEHVRAYNSEILYGLLQTEDYARAIIRGGAAWIRLSEADRRVAVRMARQVRLDGPQPLRITAVIGEGALRQQVGGPEVMKRQLEHLLQLLSAKPEQIDIRIVPFTAGAHPAFGGPYQIMSFASPWLQDLVWQEILNSMEIMNHHARISEYVVTFAETMERALSADDSRLLIAAIAKEMG